MSPTTTVPGPTSLGLRAEAVRPGRTARERLHALVTELKDGRALAPVTVVVPTKLAGIALRRDLARTPPGIAGVRILLLAQLTELLAAGALDGRLPMTGQVEHELTRISLTRAGAGLGPVAGAPATLRAVRRSLRRLREATAVPDGDALVEVLRGCGRLPGSVADVHDALRALATPYADTQDVHAAAVARLEAGTADLAEVGPVVLHLPVRFTPAEHRVLVALAERTAVHALLPVTGDVAADATTHAFARDRLGVDLELPTVDPVLPDRIVAAPDADEEVRVAIRDVVARIEAGTPAARIAVLHRRPEPYATALADGFVRAGIPVNGPTTSTLGQTAAGRALLGALGLVDAGYRREAMLDWLLSAPIVVDGHPVPVRRWAELTAEAHVVRDRSQWTRRLGFLVGRYERDRDLSTGEAREGHQRRIDRATLLRDWVGELFARLDGPTEATWTAWSRWSLDLLDHLLGDRRDALAWTDLDRDAEEQIRRTIGELAALDDVREAAGAPGDVDREAFRGVLRDELDVQAGHVGAVGTGVHLGELDRAIGLEFDHVVVVGAVEGVLPARPAEDPFLTDAVIGALRDRLGDHEGLAAIETRAERAAAIHQTVMTVLAGARSLTVTWSRVDRRRQRQQLPAPWLLRVAGARYGAGRALQLDELHELDVAWYEDLPSHEAALRGATVATDVRDRRLTRVTTADATDPALHPAIAHDATVRHGVAVERARAGEVFGPFDGHVGPHPRLEEVLSRPLSPTGLESYAACPRRYLLGRVLGLGDVEDPRELLGMSDRDMGSLIHEVLDRYVGATPARDETLDERRARVLEIAEEVLATAEERWPIGRELLWRQDREKARTLVVQAVDQEELLRRRVGATTTRSEVSVGMGPDDADPAEVVLPSGRTLAFKGRIDRIDVTADGGHVIASDYKTGKDRYGDIGEDPVGTGRVLQGAIYGLMAEALYPDAEVEAGYWMVGTEPWKAWLRSFRLWEHRDTVLGAFDLIADGISSGAFPADPGEWDDWYRAYDHCTWCPFERVCPAPGERERAWERDREAPAAGPVVALKSGAYLPVLDETTAEATDETAGNDR